MIDPLLSLSFNLYAQRGTYALLIGSGVSRSAGIPTGWEVTLDLVAKIAHLHEEDCEDNAVSWYKEKFGKDPDYSEVLSAVASTEAAQQQLLKGYFEPTEEEQEEGQKLPTIAHRAIARLVRSGHIKVIITTNFDRLLEAALDAEGIAAVVIASPDAAKGAPPIAHSKCTVIKVHGDYLDHRVKNSKKALSKYDKAMDRLLDQVFDEYGLIISGWSGEYDIALRKALERSKTRRYPLYWTGLTKPSSVAKSLIAMHSGHFVRIDGADTFFPSLLDRIEALEQFDRPHPVNVQAAVALLKRYLSEDKYRIQLRDFLMSEAEQTCSAIDAAFADIQQVGPNKESVQNLMKRLEASCEKLIHLFANGSFHAKPEQARAFFDAFQMIVARKPITPGYAAWIDLQKYSALLLAYAAGISAIASENYAVLNEIVSRPSFIRRDDYKSVPAPVRIHTHSVMEPDAWRKLIPDMDRRHTPVSDHLLDILKSQLSWLIPDEDRFACTFDDFEYLWCLLSVDAKKQGGDSDNWPPYGAFCWRRKDHRGEWFKDEAQRAITQSDKLWPPLKGGLFGGSVKRLSDAFNEAQPRLDKISERFMW